MVIRQTSSSVIRGLSRVVPVPKFKATVMSGFLTFLLVLSLNNNALAADFQLSVQPDASSVSVGSALTLTVRFIYDTCCIQAPQFSSMEVEGAVVSAPSTPVQSEETRGDRRYGVYQFTYTLIPQRQGQLEIPRLTLSGQQIPPNRVFSATPDVMQPITVESEAFTVSITE